MHMYTEVCTFIMPTLPVKSYKVTLEDGTETTCRRFPLHSILAQSFSTQIEMYPCLINNKTTKNIV